MAAPRRVDGGALRLLTLHGCAEPIGQLSIVGRHGRALTGHAGKKRIAYVESSARRRCGFENVDTHANGQKCEIKRARYAPGEECTPLVTTLFLEDDLLNTYSPGTWSHPLTTASAGRPPSRPSEPFGVVDLLGVFAHGADLPLYLPLNLLHSLLESN